MTIADPTNMADYHAKRTVKASEKRLRSRFLLAKIQNGTVGIYGSMI